MCIYIYIYIYIYNIISIIGPRRETPPPEIMHIKVSTVNLQRVCSGLRVCSKLLIVILASAPSLPAKIIPTKSCWLRRLPGTCPYGCHNSTPLS